jgi:hypothetical protein
MAHGSGLGLVEQRIVPRIFDATPLRQAESSRLVCESGPLFTTIA